MFYYQVINGLVSKCFTFYLVLILLQSLSVDWYMVCFSISLFLCHFILDGIFRLSFVLFVGIIICKSPSIYNSNLEFILELFLFAFNFYQLIWCFLFTMYFVHCFFVTFSCLLTN